MKEAFVVVIFLFTYFSISLQRFPMIKIDRPSGIIAGCTLLALSGSITLEDAYGFIDLDVISFLTGMMIMTSYLEISGFFHLAAEKLIKSAVTKRQLLMVVIAGTAILSALFVNDTICILFTPILIAAAKSLKINPVPYLLAVAFSSNVGSALTVTGNPQNIYIGVMSNISYVTFIKYAFFPVLLSLFVIYAVIVLIYQGEMNSPFSKERAEVYSDCDKVLMLKTLSALVITLILFAAKMSYPLAALTGATFVILFARVSPQKALSRVDWQLLVFFAGLFIIMGAFSQTELMKNLIKSLSPLFSEGNFSAIAGVGTASVILSNAVSNVPAVIAIYPIVEHMNMPQAFTVYLGLISTFAGNLTIMASVANLIVAGKAQEQGIIITFAEYLKPGVIITALSCAIASAFIYIAM